MSNQSHPYTVADMPLRAYIATAAMQGMLAEGDTAFDKVPMYSVVIADALLAQLSISEVHPAIHEIRDSVLHERYQLAEEGLTGDQVNAVLGIIDDVTEKHWPVAKGTQ